MLFGCNREAGYRPPVWAEGTWGIDDRPLLVIDRHTFATIHRGETLNWLDAAATMDGWSITAALEDDRWVVEAITDVRYRFTVESAGDGIVVDGYVFHDLYLEPVGDSADDAEQAGDRSGPGEVDQTSAGEQTEN
jgi:hypothetical protein